MKITAAFAISLLPVLNGWAQEADQEVRYAIKLYNLTSFEDFSRQGTSSFHQYVYSFRSTGATVQILHPTIAFQWKAGPTTSNTHEMELTSFSIERGQGMISGDPFFYGGMTVVNTALAARYEYVLGFNRSSRQKLRPSLGLSVGSYFNRTNSQPQVSNIFPSTVSYLGARLFVTPRLTKDLTKRLFVDVNIPVCVFESYMLVDWRKNPQIPARQQHKTSFTNSFLPNVFSARIGAGVRI